MQIYDVIGSSINATTRQEATSIILNAITAGSGGYVCFANAHTTVMARRNKVFHDALSGSLLSLPDGRPLYWVGRRKGMAPIQHLPGPDFMLDFMRLPDCKGLRHYFFGSTENVLKQLVVNLKIHVPDIRIAGYESPPFRALDIEEIERAISRIRRSGAGIVWIGLGAPKQELWMYHHWHALRPAVLMGVGAAFDFHAGTLSRTPEYLKSCGLEWLYRVSREPRRLMKRYLTTNSLFLYYLAMDMMTRRSNP